MAGGVSAADRSSMLAAASQVNQTVGDIQALQTQLTNEANDLVGVSWKGDAASAFIKAYEAFNLDFNKMITALENLGTNLGANEKQYAATEAANTAAASKVFNLLNQ